MTSTNDTRRLRDWYRILRRVLRTVIALAIFGVLALVVVCSLIVIQGRRDESRRVDAIVVVLAHEPANVDAYVDHAFELYRRGYAARVLLAGENVEAVQAMLIDRGVPDQALLLSQETGDVWANLRQAVDLGRQHSVQSVLVVNAPVNLLLNLKMVRDLGVSAYGSPISTDSLDIRTTLAAGLAYWKYVLLGPGT